jgi:hypothetical protein
MSFLPTTTEDIMRPKGYTASIRENGALWDNDNKRRNGWPLGTKKWSVTLKNPAGKTMSFQYHTGPAVDQKPTFNDVVGAVLSDAAFYENYSTLEEFAKESGQEPEDAEKGFKACKDMWERSRAFFGDDLDAITEATA